MPSASSRLPAVDAGVFVLGMHRSGTSAVTRVVGLLGLEMPRSDDLVQPTDKNPKGYWESEKLVAFNERLLKTVGCDMRCPISLSPGWERDQRLDRFRLEAPGVVRDVFSRAPWVWKDPRHCLAFSFWRSALDVQPVVVLVNRNPLEIAASVGRIRRELDKRYALALWERYLREALAQIEGAPVLVTAYDDVLSAPLDWCERARGFLEGLGVPTHEPSSSEVETFLDQGLRHERAARSHVLHDPDLSDAQRALHTTLDELAGEHRAFRAPGLPDESPTTEALLEAQLRILRAKHEPTRWSRVRRSRWTAPARALRTRIRLPRDRRPPLHVLHVGKTGGTALNHVLLEHRGRCLYRLVFGGHRATLADVPRGELFMFFIRDPLSRYVSAFNSRLREGRPRYHYPWRDEERIAFALFKTPDELGTALSSSDPAERGRAERAMRGIGHLNTPYSFWFGNEDALRSRLSDLFFVGFQERLDEDFTLLKRRLGLPDEADLPRDPSSAHRVPSGFDSQLGAEARANLERWYARDLAFVQLCRELAPLVNVRE